MRTAMGDTEHTLWRATSNNVVSAFRTSDWLGAQRERSKNEKRVKMRRIYGNGAFLTMQQIMGNFTLYPSRDLMNLDLIPTSAHRQYTKCSAFCHLPLGKRSYDFILRKK
jgi:hypothetical protein